MIMPKERKVFEETKELGYLDKAPAKVAVMGQT